MPLELEIKGSPHGLVCELFAERVSASPDRIAYRYFERPTRQRDVSFREHGTQVRLFAAGLTSLGLERGARVAIIAEQGPEWTIADLGTLEAGCVSVVLPCGLVEDELRELLSHYEVRVVVCGARLDAERVSAVRASVPTLCRVVGFGGAASAAQVTPLGDLMGKGRELQAERGAPSRPSARPEPGDLALLIPCRGSCAVRITHRQLGELACSIQRALDLSPDDVALPVLPTHDAAEHLLGLYGRVAAGLTTAYLAPARGAERGLDEGLRRLNPSVLLLGRAELEHFALRVAELGAPLTQRAAFEWALRVGGEVALRRRAGTSLGVRLLAEWAVADSLIWARARELLGSRIRAVLCWGVPLNDPSVEWLLAAGLQVVSTEDLLVCAEFRAVLRFSCARDSAA